ncbi:hypothetical protein SDC9_195824 [bioreactor metagenome]|uniref:Uncharacterized protein n=1 Tax=bioreactor metagenome TaxID=1076179 RepID=A0A645ICN8_9ZZZZ
MNQIIFFIPFKLSSYVLGAFPLGQFYYIAHVACHILRHIILRIGNGCGYATCSPLVGVTGFKILCQAIYGELFFYLGYSSF